ncbi:4-alpha-glucanotransferase [Flavilitoribacter nigricans]|uniref:4-alpha-glucanotransferase n=1 Tax=Flavilitoribacter nigricans (strain ATCC 23147 / DSM 23189 / NBRC 102662 / NCIMB 1420 / SS-2) TaxID=1122177 RepID=A0A2D0NIC9_FLAN2|nr:4-alpha-glucanotransferase [Flavilitoribacter nigricans]PHN08126.1 4-alpha-glucanotransferase [Flavilitoribacter nigricans DSM 23189 = NBRC 102662]
MKISFNVEYHTQWGQRIVVIGDRKELGAGHPADGLRLDYLADGKWKQNVQLPASVKKLKYRYALVDDHGNVLDEEWSHDRELNLANYKSAEVEIFDFWRPKHHPENGLDNSAFQDVIFQKKTYAAPRTKLTDGSASIHFRLQATRVAPGQRVCIVGNTPELGNWDTTRPLLLGNKDYPVWQAMIPAPLTANIEYKYGLYDTGSKQVVVLESGPNRRLFTDLPLRQEVTVINDIFFNYPGPDWKGAGLAIPVFSLRTKDSFGVGAFSDIRLLVDWARTVGLKMVQILPINDTSATLSWKDSYPYAAISVFALHPMYLDLEKLPGFKQAVKQKEYRELQQQLNALDQVDYEAVISAKLKYARQVFDKKKTTFLKSKAFNDFLKNNQHWLKPYAYFCTLRDQYRTSDFNQWGKAGTFSAKNLEEATDPRRQRYDEIAFYYYLQFYLDEQLLEVANYAREHQVILKGDIPIGIYRYSVDAWTQPELYNMDAQSGAPPDPFSDLGQNWGFPTYNWSEMAKNGYQWWQNRLQTLSRYFDAFRIDHILGFFRIWQIPYEQIEGTLGYFNPAIPVTRQEFQNRGIEFDHDRFCKPFITSGIVQSVFGQKADFIVQTFLESSGHDRYRFREAFDTQRKVQDHLQEMEQYGDPELKSKLFQLHSNVLLIEDPNGGGEAFHPRIDLQKTASYQHLDGHLQHHLNEIYHDYFYHRQEEFWREQAMTKLPAIKEATNMLICGEDLGMIPACVPEVMRNLDLFTLEIQRMSKNPETEFLQARDIPYFSVCSPSTHDMTPIRAWWEESDRSQIQRFYQQELQFGGAAPETCETYVAEKVILQHLQFPSMWAVFPIADLLGIDAELRHPEPMAERINIPANPQHYWRYRLHVSLEDLIAADTYNHHLRDLLVGTNRG